MIPIGFDVGHSTIKISVVIKEQLNQLLIPSTVLPSFHIADDNERVMAMADTVEVFDADRKSMRSFFVGNTASAQGSSSATGLRMDWVDTMEYRALMIAGVQRLVRMGVEQKEMMIVMGLPVANFSQNRERLSPIVREIFPHIKFKILMQPMFALQSIFLDEDGGISKQYKMDEESWAAIDIGHFTTDIISLERGRYVAEQSGSCRGVFRACERLVQILEKNGIKDVTLIEAEESLRTNKIKNWGREEDISEYCTEARQFIASEIIEMATRLLSSSARRRNGVLIAGGGASILFEELSRMWPNTILAPHGRFAVAEGMRRMAAAVGKASS